MNETLTAYCLKTKKNEEMFEAVVNITKRGGYMLQGKTKEGYKMSKIISKTTAEELIEKGIAQKGF